MVRTKDVTTTDNAPLYAGLALGGIAALGVGTVWVALHGAAKLTGDPAPEAHPITLALSLANGQTPWSTMATVITSVIAVAITAAATGIGVLVAKNRTKRLSSDKSARYMGNPRDLRPMLAPARRAQASRLGVKSDAVGLPLGKVLPTRAAIYSSFEDMLILIAGPRTMKSTAYAIPLIMDAPGALLATSNKRDVVDATRLYRSTLGQNWILDPQSVANEPPTWFWDPLTYVTDEGKSEKMAAQFATSARAANAKTDSYFDSEAENLIALMLLAAARGGYPITQVYSWLTAPSEREPARLLQTHGYPLHAESLTALIMLPDKQRDGVFGTARSLMGFLRNSSFTRWIVPQPGAPAFVPTDFVRTTDTLYLLSKEGGGGAGAIVAALTVAVSEAAEEFATASPRGRMPVPFLGVLDEAANICRFKDLDSLYSHYGSRGILFMTILQNWAQGEEVWGKGGMEKLWSAANVKIYGGGVDDDRYLRRLSDLIGTYERVQTSQSHSKQGASRSRSVQEKQILTVAELRELPKGRAVMFASGIPAKMIEPQPWFAGGKHVAIITESHATYGTDAITHQPDLNPSPWTGQPLV
ncbi:type IV secretory system conjugative DNA transfer family protein [Sanguibacter suarezii]|uniref:type IV secretory system conjugative DNA transfer family protein n=1 Tax=Sanguibacter suarezii TaxID=60921 RepID=UPI000829CDFB|nr:TraM recognition domain-containing protein [Sanguibacter suarezii]